MHWYIPVEFNIVESVSWLLLFSNTHVERPPIPTGFSFPPLRGEVLLLTPTPVLIKQVYRSFSLSRNKKNKSKTIQCKKLRNCDVIEVNEIRHLSKF